MWRYSTGSVPGGRSRRAFPEGAVPGGWGVWGGAGLRVLLAASVGRTLSPSASVVALLKSDFLAYFY